MATLTIGDKSVTVDDSFLKLSPADQNSTVQQIASSISAAPAGPAPASVNDVARSASTGVPIVGGALNKLDAATNAALAPLLNRFFAPEDQLPEANFSDRMAHSMRDQEGADARMAKDHPIIDTGAKLAGGIASMAPVMAAAPTAFGLAGPMSTMVRNGAASGAALSAADAAVRGENPLDASVTGGIIGGAAGPVGKGVGKVVSAIADRVRPPPLVPQNVARVGNVDVPLTPAEVTQDPALSAEQQINLRGGRGDQAQANAQSFVDARNARVNEARGNIAASLDPTGASASTAPNAAAEKIASELIAQEQARAAAETGARSGEMSPGQVSAAMSGGHTPFDAAETLSDRFAAKSNAAKADYRAKYDATANQPGEFAPGSAAGFRGDVEAGLQNADNPVSLDETNTPKALNALRVIDQKMNLAGPGVPKAATPTADIGAEHAQNVSDIRSRFGNDVAAAYDRQKAAAAPAAAGAAAAEQKPGSGFTMRDVEQVRKQLSTLYGDARRAMLAGGSGSDLHALEHIREQFDARVEQMVSQGKFSGDGPAVLKMQQEARASFADYKQKFAKRGAGDTVGAAVEKIMGRFSDTKATPDSIVTMAYGSASAPGGQMPVQIAQRIAKIFGRDSAEFETYKHGLSAHLLQGEPEKAAERIGQFLTGKGKLLAHTVFSDAERAQLARHANRLLGLAPKANEPGAVAAAIRRYTGADGGPPASPGKIIKDLMGATGKGTGDNAPLIAAHLKKTLSAESWTALRQGMWEKLTNAGDGKIPFEAQALSQRLHEFLNEGGAQLAKVLYSPKELTHMQQLASVYKQMIPVKGTTNPSGTAPMLARIASKAWHSLLPLLGLHAGGVPGALGGYALDKGLTAVSNASSGRAATRLMYGDQAKRAADPRFAKGFGLLNAGSQPAINQRRR